MRKLVLATAIACSPAYANVFISEFHYDNAGTDVGEAIEVSADLATDLSEWSVVLYNGSNGASYNTFALGQTLQDQSCGASAGTYVLNLPTNGLQNGSPDGIALIDDIGEVVEFLSYEGDLIAADGPAEGLLSTDVGVAETSTTAEGFSLKLIDGVWSEPAESSFGVCDTEVFGSPTPTPTPTPAPTPTPLPTPSPTFEVSISEIHYDNDGADEGEGIELTAPAGTDLSGWSVLLYNGNGGAVYGTETLTAVVPEVDGCDEGYLYLPIAGLQNGAPDGIALVDDSSTVVEFLSYEGTMTATNGAAQGLDSEDIGVFESSSPLGWSLQKIDGVWNEPAPNTFGGCIAEAESVKIHEIQGTGEEVAIATEVKVSAVVTADFRADTELNGFFIQEEDSDVDADSATSEGIFVYCDTCPVDVQVGDLVEVTGTPSDFFNMSQISATSEAALQVLSSGNDLPSPALIDLPVIGDIDMHYEAFEGMRVSFVDTLTVAEYFELGRFGEVLLSEGGRPRQFTDANAPDVEGYNAHLEDIAARTITLDDAHDGQNFALFNNEPVFYPQPGLSSDNFFRGGDTVDSLSGVLHYSFSKWRVRPSEEVIFNPSNARSEAPADVGGSLKVASFNVLNYFTTINETGSGCGPDGTQECRGAHSADELLRQTQKIVSAVCAIDADIVGLMEIENPRLDGGETAISELASAISAECDEYLALETGTVGTDAISVGFIYKPESVELVGTTAILDSSAFTDPNSSGSGRNRPAIAQSFKELDTGSAVTVVVNHLKSKGSGCGEGDDSVETGQGNCNLTRTLAAEEQAVWLAGNPTGIDSDYVLIIGDLNAYRNEDPIAALENAGYVDLVDSFGGADAYGYVFDGQVGYLDHALANEALFPLVTGVSEWHINADEINLLDYNDAVQDAEEQSFEVKPSATELFAPNAYRSSDHDPVVIGLALPTAISAQLLLDIFDAGVKAGEIEGVGRHWLWRLFNRYAFSSLLHQAAYFDEKGKSKAACKFLHKASKASDGLGKDLVEGPAVADLHEAIEQVKSKLACDD